MLNRFKLCETYALCLMMNLIMLLLCDVTDQLPGRWPTSIYFRFVSLMRQTGSRYPVLKVCKFRFGQFSRIGMLRSHPIDPSSIKHNSACLLM